MADAVQPRNPSVGTAMRRTAREEVENALARARGAGDLAPRVHETRGTVTRTRPLLRSVFRKGAAEDAVLPDAGQGFPVLRNAAVQLAAAKRLGSACPRVGKMLAPVAFARRSQWDTRSGEDLLPTFTARLESLILFCET